MTANDRFEGKVALVTGAASGIGRACARRFVAEGGSVVGGDLNADGLAVVADELGERFAHRVCDVTAEDDQAALAALAVERFGGLDLAVANAGTGWVSPVIDQQLSDWQRVLDICLTGVFLTFKHAGRLIVERGGGAMVTTASLNAVQAGTGMSAYCAAKGGVKMLMEVTALELGPRNVRVNAVGPGLVHTGLTDLVFHVPHIVDEYVENAPMGRYAQPEEVAGLVAYLCSDEASYISGTLQLIDGGAHLKRYPDVLAPPPAAGS